MRGQWEEIIIPDALPLATYPLPLAFLNEVRTAKAASDRAFQAGGQAGIGPIPGEEQVGNWASGHRSENGGAWGQG